MLTSILLIISIKQICLILAVFLGICLLTGILTYYSTNDTENDDLIGNLDETIPYSRVPFTQRELNKVKQQEEKDSITELKTVITPTVPPIVPSSKFSRVTSGELKRHLGLNSLRGVSKSVKVAALVEIEAKRFKERISFSVFYSSKKVSVIAKAMGVKTEELNLYLRGEKVKGAINKIEAYLVDNIKPNGIL